MFANPDALTAPYEQRKSWGKRALDLLAGMSEDERQIAIAILPKDLRRLLEYDIENTSQIEIARRLGAKNNTVHTQIKRMAHILANPDARHKSLGKKIELLLARIPEGERQKTIAALPPKCRELLEFDIGNMSLVELGRKVGAKKNHCWQRLERIAKKISES